MASSLCLSFPSPFLGLPLLLLFLPFFFQSLLLFFLAWSVHDPAIFPSIQERLHFPRKISGFIARYFLAEIAASTILVVMMIGNTNDALSGFPSKSMAVFLFSLLFIRFLMMEMRSSLFQRTSGKISPAMIWGPERMKKILMGVILASIFLPPVFLPELIPLSVVPVLYLVYIACYFHHLEFLGITRNLTIDSGIWLMALTFRFFL